MAHRPYQAVASRMTHEANRRRVGTRTRLREDTLQQPEPAPWTVPYVLYVVSVLFTRRLTKSPSESHETVAQFINSGTRRLQVRVCSYRASVADSTAAT